LPAFRSVRDGLYGGFDLATTGGDERFACERVPPGDVTLYVSHGAGLPLAHQTVAQVRAGETAQVQIGGQGRLITGRLAMPDGSKVERGARLITCYLATNWKRPAVEPPPDSHDFTGWLRLLDFFDDSEEWRAFERTFGSFPLRAAADGSFTVEDVPPGPYRLSASIVDPPYTGADPLQRLRRTIIALAKEDLNVPEAPGVLPPLDVWIVYLQPNTLIHS